jgi:hypothetical protein
MTEPSRRFPAPWHATKIPGGYVIRDADGQALAYVYARATTADAGQAKVLTQDEARRIALNIANLPRLGSISKHRKRSVLMRPRRCSPAPTRWRFARSITLSRHCDLCRY